MVDKFSDKTRTRIATVLFFAQSFFSASTIAAFTLSPIISAELANSQVAAGFPNTIGLLGRAAFAYPLGTLMDRLGRRLALTGGYSFAIFGSFISIWAVVNSSYPAFLFGALLIGMARASSDQSRYVAAEMYPLERRAKVIGWIVSAGTIGAIGGPLLVEPSGVWMESFGFEPSIATYGGPFFVSGIAMIITCVLVFLFLRPDPLLIGRQVAKEEALFNEASIEALGRARPIREIFGAPLVQLAVCAMVIGYFIMSFLMVITPLHMSHHDHTTGAISGVIMAHTLGMFGLSWWTGSLIDRFGRIQMIYAGGVVLLSASIIAPLSTAIPILGLALFLLGLGWNFAFVAGSSLLSDALNTHERARGQAASETLVAVATGMSSFSVGFVFNQGDFLLVAMIGLALSALLIMLTYSLSNGGKPSKLNPMPEK